MNDNQPPNQGVLNALIAIASGLSSALIFVLASGGMGLTMFMSYLAPAPLMIAALAFSFACGLGAIATGIVLLTAFANIAVAGAFALAIAAPSIGLAFLIFFAPRANVVPIIRSGGDQLFHGADFDRAPNYAVLGATFASAAIALGAIGLCVIYWGSYEASVEALTQQYEPYVREAVGASAQLSNVNTQSLTRALVRAAPVASASVGVLMYAFNLWFAARVALRSGHLPRVWPDIARDLRLPRALAFCMTFFCLTAWAAGAGLSSVVASALAAALGTAFAIQGYAVAHVLTRQTRLRPFLLGGLYFLTMLAPPWAVAFMAIGGLLESFAQMRAQARP